MSSGKPRCRRDQVWSPAGDVASPSLGHRHRAEDRLAAVGRQQWVITGRCLSEEPIAQHIGCLIRALRHWRDVRWLLDISGSLADLVALDAPVEELEPGREARLPFVCRGAAGDRRAAASATREPPEMGLLFSIKRYVAVVFCDRWYSQSSIRASVTSERSFIRSSFLKSGCCRPQTNAARARSSFRSNSFS